MMCMPRNLETHIAPELNRRMGAVNYEIKCGQVLQRACPQIAWHYKRGATRAQIAHRYDVLEEYQANQGIAENIVRFALVGNDNSRLGPCYEGLIPKERQESLTRKHLINNGKKAAVAKRGLFSLTRRELQEASEQGIETQGKTSWGDEERADLREKYLLPEYRRGGLTDNRKLAEYLNKKYHKGKPLRTRTAVAKELDEARAQERLSASSS